MSRFREEVSLVPGGAWVIAGIFWVMCTVFLYLMVFARMGALRGGAPIMAIFVLVGVPVLIFCYVAMIGYVYRDAQRRGMRHVMWTLLVIFIPNTIGFILYFILRDPLLQPCSQCGAEVRAGFAYCPKCGAARSKTCPQCHRQVETTWTHCANCGTGLTGSV